MACAKRDRKFEPVMFSTAYVSCVDSGQTLISVAYSHCSTFTSLLAVLYLFLLDFQADLDSRGNQVFPAVRVLHGHRRCQVGQGDPMVLECCCGNQTESGWASCQFGSSDLQETNRMRRIFIVLTFAVTPSICPQVFLLTVYKLFTDLSGNRTHHALRCKVSLKSKDTFMRRCHWFSSCLQYGISIKQCLPSLPFLL